MKFLNNLIKRHRGQSIVELLIVSPLYFLMLMGIWFFAQWLIADLHLENISRTVAWMPVYAERPDDESAEDMESYATELIENWVGNYIGEDISDEDGNLVIDNIETDNGAKGCMVGGTSSVFQLLEMQIEWEPLMVQFGMDLIESYSKCEIEYRFKVFSFFRDAIGWLGITGPDWDIEWVSGGRANYVANNFWQNSPLAFHLMPIMDVIPVYCTDSEEHPSS